MKRLSLLSCFVLFHSNVFAWDYSIKGDFSQKHTDNVNSSNTSLVADNIKDFSAYGQVKDKDDRFRIKGRATRYDKTTENNSNYFEGSYQRRFDDNLEDTFTLKVFSEKYTQTPTISTDTTADNKGYEVQIYFSKEIEKDFSFNSTYSINLKDYTNSATRKDTRYEALLGFEKIFKSAYTFAPDINIAYNNSKESYYGYYLYGFSLFASAELTENIELFSTYSYSKTFYKDRTFSSTVLGRASTQKENQTAKTFEIGISYYVTNWLTLDAKISNSTTTSNNTSNSYKSKDYEFGFGLKY